MFTVCKTHRKTPAPESLFNVREFSEVFENIFFTEHFRTTEVIKQNKKHPSKQVLQITYTLEKRVFAVVTFNSLWVVSFQTNCKKKCGKLWSVCFDATKCQVIVKKKQLKYRLCFRQFLWLTQKQCSFIICQLL